MSQPSKEPTTRTPDAVDMSPKAVAARLEDVRQLYRLCMYLVEAGKSLRPERVTR